MRASVEAAWRGETAGFDCEFRVNLPERAGGETRWVAAHGQVLGEAEGGGLARDGRPGRMVGITYDVTARRDAERRLSESEAMFRGTFDNAAVGMAPRRPPTAGCSASTAACASSSAATPTSCCTWAFQEVTHPDDLDRDANEYARLVAGEIDRYSMEKRYVRPDGSIFVGAADGDGRARRGRGGRTTASGPSPTSPARKEAERRAATLAAVVEHSGDFVGVCDTDFRPIYINPAGRRMVGIGPDAPMADVPVIDFFWPGDRAMIEREAIPALLRDGRWRGAVRFRHFATGEPIDTLWNASTIRDDRGQPVGYATVSPDLRELNIREIERARAQERAEAAQQSAEAAQAEAERASAAKDDFLAKLSHELRTPLTPVLTLAQLMEADAALPPEARETAATIRRNVQLECRLIDDLLDLTRIARGKVELQRADVDLNELVGRVVGMCEGEIISKRIKLTIDPGASRNRISGDAARLQQALWNLVKNAVKFTPAGGAHRGRHQRRARRRGRGWRWSTTAWASRPSSSAASSTPSSRAGPTSPSGSAAWALG